MCIFETIDQLHSFLLAVDVADFLAAGVVSKPSSLNLFCSQVSGLPHLTSSWWRCIAESQDHMVPSGSTNMSVKTILVKVGRFGCSFPTWAGAVSDDLDCEKKHRMSLNTEDMTSILGVGISKQTKTVFLIRDSGEGRRKKGRTSTNLPPAFPCWTKAQIPCQASQQQRSEARVERNLKLLCKQVLTFSG